MLLDSVECDRCIPQGTHFGSKITNQYLFLPLWLAEYIIIFHYPPNMDPAETPSPPKDDLSWDTHFDESSVVETLAMTRAMLKVRSLYNEGTPLFTKEAIRDLDQQLEKSHERGQKVSVRGMDGAKMEFQLETGRTLPTQEGSDSEEFLCVIDHT